MKKLWLQEYRECRITKFTCKSLDYFNKLSNLAFFMLLVKNIRMTNNLKTIDL